MLEIKTTDVRHIEYYLKRSSFSEAVEATGTVNVGTDVKPSVVLAKALDLTKALVNHGVDNIRSLKKEQILKAYAALNSAEGLTVVAPAPVAPVAPQEVSQDQTDVIPPEISDNTIETMSLPEGSNNAHIPRGTAILTLLLSAYQLASYDIAKYDKRPEAQNLLKKLGNLCSDYNLLANKKRS